MVRGARGIPQIYAANVYDLFYTEGCIHATDRLFQMGLLRRSAAGTLAEMPSTAALQTDYEISVLTSVIETCLRGTSLQERDAVHIFRRFEKQIHSFG